MRKGPRLLALGLTTLLVASACTGPQGTKDSDSSGAAPAGGDVRVAVVTHGGAGDAFWDVVKNGAEAAGKQEDVSVTYQGDGDPAKQAQLIDAAVADKVTGLVVSMANPDALKDSIGKAVAAGIQVVTINSGQDKSKEFGALTHVGQSEVLAGEGAGEKFKAAGTKKLLCVVHEAGNIGLEDRCKGAKNVLGSVENLQVDINNLTDATARIKGKLQADASIDGVLTLNPAIAIAGRDAVKESGKAANLATFDLNADVVKAIKAKEISFAVDQQQYLQGYLPVVFLALYGRNANTVGGGQPVYTGPGFVTEENADTVEKLAGAGTR
jgi:simple sugar transport system substrate-binding protein